MDNKPLKEIEIKHKIENYRKQMGELDKWKSLHLDDLDFIKDNNSVQKDEHIWSLPEDERNRIHQK